jgi:hypothetical protein
MSRKEKPRKRKKKKLQRSVEQVATVYVRAGPSVLRVRARVGTVYWWMMAAAVGLGLPVVSGRCY